jgi:hypothetical protein
MANDHEISMTSIISQRTKEGLVHYAWGTQETQFTITEARAHALALLEVAEAAASDAALYRFLVDELHQAPEKAAFVIRELRQFRNKRKTDMTPEDDAQCRRNRHHLPLPPSVSRPRVLPL